MPVIWKSQSANTGQLLMPNGVPPFPRLLGALNEIVSTRCGLGHTPRVQGVQEEFSGQLRWLERVPDWVGIGAPSCHSVLPGWPLSFGPTSVSSQVSGGGHPFLTGMLWGLMTALPMGLVLAVGPCVSLHCCLVGSSQGSCPLRVAHEQT